ncbi:MAG: trehalase family glycosidase [Bacteroidota bacterium]
MNFTQYKNKREFRNAAKAVLNANWTGQFTKPAPSLYPHQWNWDAGFIAIGYANYDLDRAIAEMRALFAGQWSNGFLPQIIFHPERKEEGQYFPGADFWQAHRSAFAPKQVQTSGITMPPVHGFVLWNIYERCQDKEKALEFLREFYPKVMALHRYLYEHRDPQEEGLVHIVHPWESGTDNSPVWDAVLESIDPSQLKIPAYERKDLQNKKAAQHRPTDLDYDRYVYLVDLYRQNEYADAAIWEKSPFLVQDPLFNAILIYSNECMVEVAQLLGEEVEELILWNELSIYSMNEKLWNEETGFYDAWNVRNDVRIPSQSASGLIPMLAKVPDQDQAERMLQNILGAGFIGPDENPLLLCPSYSRLSDQFNPQKYWRGPIWVNINWLLYHGLLHYDFTETAEQVKMDTLGLLEKQGFYEYFDPHKLLEADAGYGTNQFSWSAALCLDFLSMK